MITREGYTVWVCVDCYFAHEGVSSDERGEDYPADVLSLISDSADVTSGLLAEEHAEDCPVFPVLADGSRGGFNGSAECECECRDFSWSRCDGCGSTLGGSRHALTVWEA